MAIVFCSVHNKILVKESNPLYIIQIKITVFKHNIAKKFCVKNINTSINNKQLFLITSIYIVRN
jgi:hypothetical protein